MVNIPLRVPPAVGVNVTLITQEPLAAMERFAVQVVPEAVAKSDGTAIAAPTSVRLA